MGLIWAVTRQRCPRCRQGPVFTGLMTTRQRCPVCDLVYVRDYGYFVGAMYASYFFSFVSTLYWLPMLFMGFNPWLIVTLPAIQLIVQVPLTFRYARVIWLHIDHGFDPEAIPPSGRDSNLGVTP